MIQNTNIEITGSISNPDKPSIQQKSVIDIKINPYDISASNYVGRVKLNYSQTETVVVTNPNSDVNDTFFTPLYVEKIDYNEWKKRINKSFQELGTE